MPKRNCWEFTQCGRQPGGEKAEELGVCPAAQNTATDGINEGINGGRSCWVVARTLCFGEIQGDFSTKLGSCLQCGFYALVREEQGQAYINTIKILQRMNKTRSMAVKVQQPHKTTTKLRSTP